jgi:hypothetical protein
VTFAQFSLPKVTIACQTRFPDPPCARRNNIIPSEFIVSKVGVPAIPLLVRVFPSLHGAVALLCAGNALSLRYRGPASWLDATARRKISSLAPPCHRCALTKMVFPSSLYAIHLIAVHKELAFASRCWLLADFPFPILPSCRFVHRLAPMTT